MTKKARTTKKSKTGTASAIDYRPLIRSCREAAECALDIAAESAGDFPGGVEAAERVRTFVQARLDGRAARVCVEENRGNPDERTRALLDTMFQILAQLEQEGGGRLAH